MPSWHTLQLGTVHVVHVPAFEYSPEGQVHNCVELIIVISLLLGFPSIVHLVHSCPEHSAQSSSNT